MKIETRIIWENRSGRGQSFFHPRACALGNPGHLFMTVQTIGGSDYYGPLQQSFSHDGGRSWSEPIPIPGYEWRKAGPDISEGVCDVVPEFHAPTRTVLAIGHNVYYRNGRLFDSLGDFGKTEGSCLRRFPVWGICTPDGHWIRTREKLTVPGFEECSMFSCGCSQRLFSDQDRLFIPITFGHFGERDRKVTSMLFRYDGHGLDFLQCGTVLALPAGRGLLEPSLTFHGTDFLMTIRAEDGRGYHTHSKDGLSWDELCPWSFDDGTELEMSTTQQHFLKLGGRLFLLYTRKDGKNGHVFRFRAPLFIAEIDSGLHIVRSSEQIVFPVRDEGEHAAGMGNFQVTKLDDTNALVTVGEERNYCSYLGDTLCAFLQL